MGPKPKMRLVFHMSTLKFSRESKKGIDPYGFLPETDSSKEILYEGPPVKRRRGNRIEYRERLVGMLVQ